MVFIIRKERACDETNTIDFRIYEGLVGFRVMRWNNRDIKMSVSTLCYVYKCICEKKFQMNRSTVYGSFIDSDRIEISIRNGELEASSSSEQAAFTIDDAIEKMSYGLFQSKLSTFVSLLWMSDAMELILISIVGPTLQCEWQLSSYYVALLPMFVFGGEMIGSMLWGISSDKYGRKRILSVSTAFLVYFGLLTSLAPNYKWFLSVRFFVGVCMSALTQGITYISEFLPNRYRSSSILLLELAWAGGIILEYGLAILVLNRLGWRLLIALTALPGFLVLFFLPFIPESPRFLLECDELEKAHRILERGSRQNCRELPRGKLVYSTPSETPNLDAPPKQKGNILEFFSREYRLTTGLLLVIWCLAGFYYFGIVLLTTEIFQYDTHCVERHETNITYTETVCTVLTQQQLIYSLLISLGEFPGILLSILLSDTVGRKLAVIIQFLLASLFTLLINICTGSNDAIVKTVFLFLARACMSGGLQVLYVYTPEMYPTRIRSSGLSLFNTMSRIGMIGSSFAAIVLLQKSFYGCMAVYTVTGIVGASVTLMLPYETKGANLGERKKRKFLC